MCSINLFLKFLISFIFIVVIFFTDNYYLFFLILFYLLLLSIVDKNIKNLLFLFFIVCILLFCMFTSKVRLIVQICLALSFVYLFVTSTSKENRNRYRYKYLYNDRKMRKKLFYEMYKDKVVNVLKEKYKSDDIPNKIVNNELDRLYLYGKVRFYGYGNSVTGSRLSRFTLYDLVFLLTSLFVLVIILIYR